MLILGAPMNQAVVHLGGRFIPPSEAKVDLLDRGWLLGDGVFATMRGYDGVCFRPEAHLEALARGAEALGIALPATPSAIIAVADEAARRTGANDAYVRVTLTRGSFAILARPMDVPDARAYEDGIETMVVKPRRIPPECVDPTFKTTSYAPQIVAWREIEARGIREGIQLALDGSIACGTTSNVFVVEGDRLRTPPISTGCRPGITRAVVMAIAAEQGMEVREERIELAALETADEAFFTSTRVECLPFRWPGARSANAGFPVTARLRAAFRERVLAETALRSVPPVSR
jgi:branched-chain amino acid aminotransferase